MSFSGWVVHPHPGLEDTWISRTLTCPIPATVRYTYKYQVAFARWQLCKKALHNNHLLGCDTRNWSDKVCKQPQKATLSAPASL